MHSIRSIHLFYGILSEYVEISTHFLKTIWERELNIQISDEEWNMAWKNAKNLSVCNRVRATQLKTLHRAHISPSQRSRFGADISLFCSKCKIEIGNLTHCLWFCNKIQRFLLDIPVELKKKLKNTGCFFGSRSSVLPTGNAFSRRP